MKRSVILTCIVCLVTKAYTSPAPTFGLYDWFASYYDDSTEEEKDDDSKDIFDVILDYFYDIFCPERGSEASKPNEIKPNSSVQTESITPQVNGQNSTLKDKEMTTIVQDSTNSTEKIEIKPSE